MRTLAALCLALFAVLAGACRDAPSPLAEGERRWQAAVWNGESVPFRDAIGPLEHALDANGGPNPRIAFLLASSYLFSGRADLAEPLLDLLRSGPIAPEPMLLDGWLAAMAHARPDAEIALSACLDRLATSDSPFVDEMAFLALFWRGEERSFAGNFGGAADDLLAARDLLAAHGGAVNRRLTLVLAESLAVIGAADHAEEVLRAANDADPSWAPHAQQLGLVCLAQQRIDEARDWFREAAERDPGYPDPQLRLARLALDAGDLEETHARLDQYEFLFRERALATNSPPSARDLAESATGFGAYFAEVARRAAESGDDTAARVALGRARDSLLHALDGEPRCRKALVLLIQVAAQLGEDEAVLAEWRSRLESLGGGGDAEGVDVLHTFC